MHLRVFELAVEFYRASRDVRLPGFLRLQLQRAAASVALNLSEGSGRTSVSERRHTFAIALGSIRECQAIVALEPQAFPSGTKRLLEQLAASVYRLIERTEARSAGPPRAESLEADG